MTTPNWNQYLLVFVFLSIAGFTLVIVSGFWQVLALVLLAAILMLVWLHHRKTALPKPRRSSRSS